MVDDDPVADEGSVVDDGPETDDDPVADEGSMVDDGPVVDDDPVVEMTMLTVLVTGCGAPGTIGTCWSLRENDDGRPVRIVGTDVNPEQVGRFTCDAFARVPHGGADDFVPALLDVCAAEDVDVVLPQVTAELPVLAASRSAFDEVGTAVAVSSADAIEHANDKANLIRRCEELGVPAPETTLVRTWTELESAADELGYPADPFVVKPPVANGQRGFRVVREDWDRQTAFYERKPRGTTTTMDRLHDVLGDSFPALLTMEYLPGEEYTIDACRVGENGGEDGSPNGRSTIVVPRSRDAIRSGISFETTVTADEELIRYATRLAESLDLRYAFGFQFKRAADGTPKILECNPRVQGTMVTSTLAGANLIYAAVAAAAGETDASPSFEADWGTSFYRYWGGIGVSDGEIVGNIGDRV